MRPFASPRHLLVDLDGTLLANRDLKLKVDFMGRALRAFSRHGGWLKAVRALRAMYLEMDRPPKNLAEELTNDRRAVQAFSKALGVQVEESRQILQTFVTQIFPLLKKHFYPVPGAKDFLEWAKSRYPMTLATNPVWPIDLVKLRLEWAGVDSSIFGTITHAGVMHACKPAPEYYREIVEKLHQNEKLEPAQYLLIGDDVRKDLPATRVGIPVFIVGADKILKKIERPRDSAPAWSGSFKTLQTMLEESQ